LLDRCAKTEVIAEPDMISRRCNPVATSSNFAWIWQWTTKSTLTMKRLMNSPRTSSPEQPLGHVVCKHSIYKTAFIFRREKRSAASLCRRTRTTNPQTCCWSGSGRNGKFGYQRGRRSRRNERSSCETPLAPLALERLIWLLQAVEIKGPEAEDHTLYASHTVWENRAVFEAWTKSEAFRAAHSRAGDNKPLYLDHPQFEGFEVRQTVKRG